MCGVVWGVDMGVVYGCGVCACTCMLSICESVLGGVVHVYASQILIILQTAVFAT